jgi:DNA modification methylase
MARGPDLEEYVPESCRELLDRSDEELRSAIPELARDEGKMGEIARAVKSVPSHHELYCRDARDMGVIEDESVHLVVTSPPYFDLKEYERREGQLGHVEEYDRFHEMLDQVWQECYDKLVPGGRMCVVTGDVLRSRSDHGRHRLVPLHSTIQERGRKVGFDNLAPIIWYKIGNASLESGGNARFLGKPYEPGAVIKNDVEYVLFLRKPGGYRSPSKAERVLSTIAADDHQQWFRQVWDDIVGEPQGEHPAPYPAELAQRLVRMFSFVGDTVLDPFAGTGSTALGASRAGRNSVSVELEPTYVDIAEERITAERGRLTNFENLTVDVVR